MPEVRDARLEIDRGDLQPRELAAMAHRAVIAFPPPVFESDHFSCP